MKIEYFTIENIGNGVICRHSIDTEGEKYISHTEDSVTFKDSYNDDLWNTKYYYATHTRKFNIIRDKLIDSHKKMIDALVKDFHILLNSESIERYNSFIYKK